MPPIDIHKIALPKGKVMTPKPKKKLPRHKDKEHFIKGPIPLDWATIAARLPGKSCQVGNALWYLAGLSKSTPTIKLTQIALNKFGVSRYCKYRALRHLELAGLITLDSAHGKNPMITILTAPKGENAYH